MKLLIIEDEADIVRYLELELQHEGYTTVSVLDGLQGLEAALNDSFDVILLDVLLPGMNGLEVLREIRRVQNTPVILVTAVDSISGKVQGLDAGANDYLTKPFHIEELLARIRAVVRTRAMAQKEEVLTAGDLTLYPAQRTVFRQDHPLTLTKTQYDLLEYLMRNKNLVLTRDQILDAVWGYHYSGDSNIVDVYVRYVRSRIHDQEGQRLIHTVRGVGYVLQDPKP